MMPNDILKVTQADRDAMPPERLSLILGVQYGTLYKAFKKVGADSWVAGSPLSERDISALVYYYADLGNDTARKLAESRRKAEEPARNTDAPATESEVMPAESGEQKKETPQKASVWYYLADLVFFGVSGIVAYELWFFLKVWGLLFWGVYAGALFFCLAMAKDKRVPETAQYGYTAVVILECVAFFSHLSMANNLAIKAAKAGELPFLYNQWSGSMTAPFYIACALAAVLSGVPVFLLWARLNITKELSKQ